MRVGPQQQQWGQVCFWLLIRLFWIKKVNGRLDPISATKKEDNMGIKNKVLTLMIVLVAVSFAGHAIAVDHQPPDSLDQMINITRRMVNELKRLDPNSQSERYQKKRREIADWVTNISANRIYNCNDREVRNNLSACYVLGDAREKWKYLFDSNKIIAKWAWENRAGNCEENANLTYYILRQAGVTDTLRILFSDEWHGFTVWGVQEGADLKRPLTWNPDALVLDSWTGKVLTPSGAHNDYYIGNGGKNPIVDRTNAYDTTASVWNGPSPSDDFFRRLMEEMEPVFEREKYCEQNPNDPNCELIREIE
ncbi:MAG TPA: hypothetical protein DCY53_04090 [Desulfobacteraceae bacterium]|nr:hypothetical protein [Desulfobacteraceae bacterium]